MSLLLTGSTGLLGKELKKILNCYSPIHRELDIKNKQAVYDYIIKNRIDTIIHTAALTSVRKCEEMKEEAWQTNVYGTRNLVESLKKVGENHYFVFISTACVFDGFHKMYSENSIPNPVNFYGLTKLLGESIVSTLNNHLIIRTNFVDRNRWPYEKAFTDRFGTYLFVEDVVKGIKEMYEAKQKGIIHLTGDKIFSMYDIAKKIDTSVKPMNLTQYNGPHLTINMTLDSTRWKKYSISEI